jgi:hypothetical protein
MIVIEFNHHLILAIEFGHQCYGLVTKFGYYCSVAIKFYTRLPNGKQNFDSNLRVYVEKKKVLDSILASSFSYGFCVFHCTLITIA